MRTALSSLRALVTIMAVVALGCASLATSPPPPDYDLLADEILQRTPEHVHFVRGYRFSWVLLSSDHKDAPAALIDAVKRKLAQRYRLYEREADLPAGSIVDDDVGSRLIGGFFFSFQVTRVAADTLKVDYYDYEASLAGSASSTTYRWNGSAWVVEQHDPGVVF